MFRYWHFEYTLTYVTWHSDLVSEWLILPFTCSNKANLTMSKIPLALKMWFQTKVTVWYDETEDEPHFWWFPAVLSRSSLYFQIPPSSDAAPLERYTETQRKTKFYSGQLIDNTTQWHRMKKRIIKCTSTLIFAKFPWFHSFICTVSPVMSSSPSLFSSVSNLYSVLLLWEQGFCPLKTEVKFKE